MCHHYATYVVLFLSARYMRWHALTKNSQNDRLEPCTYPYSELRQPRSPRVTSKSYQGKYGRSSSLGHESRVARVCSTDHDSYSELAAVMIHRSDVAHSYEAIHPHRYQRPLKLRTETSVGGFDPSPVSPWRVTRGHNRGGNWRRVTSQFQFHIDCRSLVTC